MNKPENLKQLIDRIEAASRANSMSDDYLKEHGYQTRDDIVIGDYVYGIVMVPEDLVLPHLKRLLSLSEQS